MVLRSLELLGGITSATQEQDWLVLCSCYGSIVMVAGMSDILNQLHFKIKQWKKYVEGVGLV